MTKITPIKKALGNLDFVCFIFGGITFIQNELKCKIMLAGEFKISKNHRPKLKTKLAAEQIKPIVAIPQPSCFST